MSLQTLVGLKDKSVALIGGGQGIGAACGHCFALAGCDVVIIDEDAAAHVGGIVQSSGRKAVTFIGDALDASQLPELLGRAAIDIGRPLDVLVTVVGQAEWRDAIDLTIEQWDLEHHRNVRYVFAAAQALAATMLREGRGGSIVAITSVSGLQSAPRHAAYGAVKAGLINLVKSLAVEFAPHGIRVNSVAPGVTASPRVKKLVEQSADPADGVRRVPLGHLAPPEEIAKAVVFLASDLASYVTGQTLAVDGGASARFSFA